MPDKSLLLAKRMSGCVGCVVRPTRVRSYECVFSRTIRGDGDMSVVFEGASVVPRLCWRL